MLGFANTNVRGEAVWVLSASAIYHTWLFRVQLSRDHELADGRLSRRISWVRATRNPGRIRGRLHPEFPSLYTGLGVRV